MKKLLLFWLSVVLVGATNYVDDYQSFKLLNPQKTQNIYGNFVVIGNTVQGVTNCKRIQKNGKLESCFIETKDNNEYYNNHYITRYFNKSDFNEINTTLPFRGSIAYLRLPKTAKKIVWAAIFWQGHVNNYSYQYSNTDQTTDDGYDWYYAKRDKGNKYFYYYIMQGDSTYYKLNNDLPNNESSGIKNTEANKIDLQIGDLNFEVEADELKYKSDSRYFCKLSDGCEEFKGDEEDNKDKFIKKAGVKYSAYKVLGDEELKVLNEKMQIIKDKGLSIAVSNLFSSQGLDSGLGDYGAWSLVVIYSEDSQNSDVKLRNIGIYEGFQNLYSKKHDLNIEINHLILPKNGNVDSTMAIFSAEGEKSQVGDYAQINDMNLTENVPDFDPNNEFDSQLSDDILRFPMIQNNNGIDIDVFDASKALTLTRNNNPDADEYSVNLHVHTEKDGIFLSMIAFATQLYEPRVCYYIDKIEDKDGNVIYKNGSFVNNAKIDTSKEYNITIWYSNMKPDENDTDLADADKVKIFMTTENFKYKSDSTFMRNVDWDEYLHQTDEEGDDLFTYVSDKNESDYHIGEGADADTGGLMRVKEKAYATFVGKFEKNETNETEIDLDNVFHFKASFETKWIKITDDNAQAIPKCVPFNTKASLYSPPAGTFNVVEHANIAQILNLGKDPKDVNNPLNNLYTKIVNKNYTMNVVHMGEDDETLSEYQGPILIAVIDQNSTSAGDVNISNVVVSKYVVLNGKTKEFNITIPTAVKNGRFVIGYIKGDSEGLAFRWTEMTECKSQIENEGDVTFSCIWQMMIAKYGQEAEKCKEGAENGNYDVDCYCADKCNYWKNALQGNDPNKECLKCVFGRWGEFVYSRDNFAVRPKQFQIIPPTGKLKAGESYTFVIKALDENNLPSLNYNETLNLTNISPTLDYNDTNASIGCNRGVLSFDNAPVKFNNGIANVSLNYSEVGDLNITVKELNETAYAAVDINDSQNPEGLKIKESSVVKTFVPYRFTILNPTYQNGGNGFTYISRDLNMSSILDFTIRAENKSHNITRNYNKQCYAKNMDINVTHTNVPISFNLIYKELNSTVIEKANNQPIEFNITKDKFTSGQGQVKLFVNFKKAYNNPVEPFDMNLTRIDLVDEDSVVGNSPTYNNLQADFIYGKIDIPNIASFSNVIHNTVKYEYFSNGKWVVNTAHNTPHDGNVTFALINGVNTVIGNINGGYQDLKYTTTKPLPYSVKGEYAISSWMWYHSKATTYQAPSSTNHNCLTHPCNKINFMLVGSSWAGVGENNSTYAPDKNRTIKANSSADVNNSNAQVKTINW
ncbi:hypothetical protein [Caminibacter pacificus]